MEHFCYCKHQFLSSIITVKSCHVVCIYHDRTCNIVIAEVKFLKMIGHKCLRNARRYKTHSIRKFHDFFQDIETIFSYRKFGGTRFRLWYLHVRTGQTSSAKFLPIPERNVLAVGVTYLRAIQNLWTKS